MATENIQKLVLIKPVNEAIPEQSSYAPRPTGLEGKRVGLLDNSKNNAGRFLEMVAGILHEQYGFRHIVRYRKPSASKPVAPEVIEEWKELCDLAIVGVGD
jgi:predicted GTPase